VATTKETGGTINANNAAKSEIPKTPPENTSDILNKFAQSFDINT
jgi:hypothetical protein